jgi:hypothetical protein
MQMSNLRPKTKEFVQLAFVRKCAPNDMLVVT